MIQITKREAEIMRKRGYDKFVKHSYSRHKKYYLVEEQDDIYKYNKKTRRVELVRLSALNMLKEYRRSVGITD